MDSPVPWCWQSPGHWQAWLRLVLTSLIILAGYAIRVRQAMKSGLLPAGSHIHFTVPVLGAHRELHLSLAEQRDAGAT